ncbi:hypothetical protein HD553DRAFT_345066 [Filobasidium floriforme]|uniref:uncharacterized protein n=1 Tax=Filobasidium floriforme TaxID=5210 RepID=UPI001E8EC88C|nr:uncharacterized protein HD553DRAFT_345066 [Filobasidium floriforme]KAH8080152.1 hypothetical protein HD553DRAFT_345066 [Filobasidium floriforme]
MSAERKHDTSVGNDVANQTAETIRRSSNLTMQVVLRRDLLEKLEWPVGPLMAQAAHAATAVMVKYREHENVKSYEQDLDNMRKAVLQIPDESQLLFLRDALETADIGHYLWTEQP